MLSLCHPYVPTITCLCDDTASVLRCFLTGEDGDSVNTEHTNNMATVQRNNQRQSSSVHCDNMADIKTEIVMALAIIIMVIIFIFG